MTARVSAYCLSGGVNRATVAAGRTRELVAESLLAVLASRRLVAASRSRIASSGARHHRWR